MKNIFLKSKFTYAVFLIIMRITKRFQRHHLSEYSAYSVMFIILSFVPFFIILLSFLKALPVFTETDGYRITGADELTEYLKNLLSEIDVKAGGDLLSLTSLLSLWSASRGLIGIINGLNRITVHFRDDSLHIQHDLSDIFLDTGDRGELMLYTGDLNRSRCSAGQ